MGGNSVLAFRPYIVMVEQCEFPGMRQCDQPALDLGYAELASLTRTRIVTKNKKIARGYIGAAQQVEDVTVDVALAGRAAAAPVHAARGPQRPRRPASTATSDERDRQRTRGLDQRRQRPERHVPQDAGTLSSRTQRAIRQHAQAGEKDTNKTDVGRGPQTGMVNPAAHELAPTNGWVHPFIFYKCTFGPKTYAYALITPMRLQARAFPKSQSDLEAADQTTTRTSHSLSAHEDACPEPVEGFALPNKQRDIPQTILCFNGRARLLTSRSEC